MRTAIHEIRNQLAVAVAGLEAFLDRKMEPTDARLHGILYALREIDALVDDLPRDRTIEFETHAEAIDVCSLIGSVAASMEGFALEHGIRLSVHQCAETHPECRHYFGDPVRIGEIVTNVLTNAVRYTQPGGVVEVDCHRDGTALRFTVSDQGPGIRPSERERIFESGFRGAGMANTPGSGIGLAVVKDYVERHGGTVRADNRSQGGATFTIRLPVAGASCGDCLATVPAAPREDDVNPR